MASSNIARLGVVLGIDTAAFQADVDKAISENKKLKDAITRDTNAAVKEIANLKYATEDYGKEITKVAQIEREIADGRFKNTAPKTLELLRERAAAYDAVANSSKKAMGGMNAQQQLQLTYQTTDLITQIASGQSAIIALMQQGGQLKDSMGGLGPMFRMLAGLITPFSASVGLLAIGLGSVGYATYSARKELDELQNTVAITGGYTKDMGERFFTISRILSENLNVSVGDAKNVLMALIESGKFTSSTIDNVSQTILTFAKVSGTDATQAAQKLIPALDGTASSSKRLNDQYHFLSLEQYKQIEALEKQGKTQEAIIIQSTALEQSLQSQRRELSNLEKAWSSVKDAASQAWDSMLSKFRAPTVVEELSIVSKKIYDLQKAANGENAFGRMKALDEMPQFIARYEKLAHDYLMTLAEVQAKEKEASNIDDHAKNNQKRLSLMDAVRAQERENALQGAEFQQNEIMRVELEGQKKIADLKADINQKNRDEAFNFEVARRIEYNTKLVGIEAETAMKITAIRNKQFQSRLEDERAYAQQELEDLSAAEAAYGKITSAMDGNIRAEQHSLDLEKTKLLMKYDSIGMSEKEIALRQEMIDYEEKLYQLELRTDLQKEDRLRFAERYKEMHYEKQQLIEMTDRYKTLDEMAKSVYSNMGNYIDQFVQTGKFSFQDFVRSTIQGLIAIQMKAQLLSLTGGSSGIGDVLKGVFGGIFSGGSSSSSAAYGGGEAGGFARASGGPVASNTSYLVGEQGPEIFMPSGAGTIIPNNLLSGGGGQTINYNGPYIANMSAIDTQTGVQFLAKNKQTIWASYQSANRSVPVSR